MNAPLDHHFIPAFFLAQWTDANGKLIEYTKRAGKVIAKPVGPRATGFERELYSFPELPADAAQFIEQNMQSELPPTLSKFISRGGQFSRPQGSGAGQAERY
jgi:hypothetical protein